MTAATTGINTTTDNAVKAYSSGKVIYISGKLTGYNAALISINGTTVGNYKFTNDSLATLDESGLVDGVYILQVNNGSKIYTFKLILNS